MGTKHCDERVCLSVCLSVCPLVYVKNSKSTTVAVSKLGCGNVIFDEATQYYYKIDREHTETCY